MKNITRLIFAGLFISFSAFALKVGDAAPAFSLKGADGKDYKLEDFKGKLVVLEWFNDGCPYVQKHYESKNMQGLQSKYTAKGVVWLSVISSAPKKQGHKTAAEVQKIQKDWATKQTAFLLDEAGSAGKAYGAKTTPHMFLISTDGKVVYQGAIDDQPSTDQATVKTAKPLFANAVEEALAKKPITVAETKPYGCSVKF